MHVLIVSAVFPPEPVVSAQTSAQIAEELVRRGNDVTVITAFPNRPSGKLYPGYMRAFYSREQTAGGYELVRCFAFLSGESSMLSRFLENISFGLTSGWRVLTGKRPDVIYANTWPIFATGILYVIARLRRVPLVISVQDVYPESLAAQGRMKLDSWLARWMRSLDGAIARGAAQAIVISEHFASIYRDSRHVAPDRLSVIPNWADSSLINTTIDATVFRRAQGISEDNFVLAYGGNIGVAAGVETVIDAMRWLADLDWLRLVIAGDGSRLATCKALADQIGTNRVSFYSPWPSDETSMVLRAADVLVLPTRRSQSMASVPSKLIAYMLAARPIIALALPGSDVAAIIEQSGCGWVVPPDRPDLLASNVREVMSMGKIELNGLGQGAREYALQNFTQESCLAGVLEVVERAHARKGDSTSLVEH